MLLQHSCLLLLLQNMQKVKFLVFCCLKHLCPMLWRLVLYLKADGQGTRNFLSAAATYKALWQSYEASWEKASGDSATISGSLSASQCMQIPVLPGYYFESNSYFKTFYFKHATITGFSKIKCCFVIRLQELPVVDVRGDGFLVERSGSVINFTLQEQCLLGNTGHCVMLKNRFLDIHLETTFGRVVQHFLQFSFTTKTYATKLFPVPRLEAEPKGFCFSSFPHPWKKTTHFIFPLCSNLLPFLMNLAHSYFLLSSVVRPRTHLCFGRAIL